MNWLVQFEVIGEVGFAMLLGGIIGFERELVDKPPDFAPKCSLPALLLFWLGWEM